MLRPRWRMLRPFEGNVTPIRGECYAHSRRMLRPFEKNVTLAFEEERVMEGIPVGNKRHDDAANIGNSCFGAAIAATGRPKKKNKKEKAPLTPKEKNKIKTPLLRTRAKVNTA